MEKAHGLRQPSRPTSLGDAKATNGMRNGGRKRAAVPPRGAFSAQMLRPPSIPTFSTDSPLGPEDEELSGGMYDYAFVTSRREPSEAGNQALSPPPPPPPLPNHSRSTRRPMAINKTESISTSPSVKNLANRTRTVGATKSKGVSPRIQSAKSISDDQSSNQSTEKPTPSVHPIDTLSKKLRQQAMELTHVYEELEKQNLQLDAYKQQIQDQKLQLEQLRTQRRKSIEGSSRAQTSSRATALEQQKRSAQMMIGTPSTGKSLGQKRGELERKVKEAEKEKKKYELAAKRIEKALVELQVFQNDRMRRLIPSDRVSNQEEDDSGDLETLLNEQRAYIRVLEEAVHLKATDFEITGHEELLVVLAELRHTIYEQEKDVAQKSGLLSSLQEQLEHEKQQHIEVEDRLLTCQKQQEEMAQHFHEQESELQAQLDGVLRQLQQRDSRLVQLEGVSTSAQRSEEALQSRLAAATKTQNLMESKLEDAARSLKTLQERLDASSAKYEEAKQRSEVLQQECAKKQSHLDEMNALQEELLGSVDKYVGKAKKARDKVERLEVELRTCKDKEAQVQKQTMDAAQSTDEKVATLQAVINTAEGRAKELQTQCVTLLREKEHLENALTEVQQHLEVQTQENNEQQQEFAAKERKCHQVEEEVAELEASLSTALMMMLNKSTSENDESSTDTDEHAFLLNQSVLQELRTCCLALNTLTTENGASQCILCPSFPEIIARMAAIGEGVQIEVNRSLASWSRERTNLVEAYSMLHSTAQMCQDEMEKRHVEIRDYRQQLMEVEVYAMQVDTLEEQLRHAEAECKMFHALEQHAANQEEALAAKQARIQELSTENDRLVTVENAYSAQMATNARYSQRPQDEQETARQQRKYNEELETALESAATFAEQQNECNQQLNVQVERLESSEREQLDRIKALGEQNSAFSSRFVALVKRYMTFLRTAGSLQDPMNLFDAEVRNGDVLRLLQLFPALVEEYIATNVTSRATSPDHSTVPSKRSSRHVAPIEKTGWQSPAQEASPSKLLKTSSPLAIAQMRSGESSTAQLAEQLQLIRGAFQSYKDDLESD